MAGQLSEAQARNFRRWPILGEFVNPNYFVGDSYEAEVAWMKNWIQERVAWIDTQFLSPPALKPADNKLGLETEAGEIYYTLDGSDPRLPGGDVSPHRPPVRGTNLAW